MLMHYLHCIPRLSLSQMLWFYLPYSQAGNFLHLLLECLRWLLPSTHRRAMQHHRSRLDLALPHSNICHQYKPSLFLKLD